MYPARFEYFAPTTVEEAVSILERYGDDAKVLLDESADAVDPACGMTVPPAGAETFIYPGTTYAFCCAGCQGRFEAEASRYPVVEAR